MTVLTLTMLVAIPRPLLAQQPVAKNSAPGGSLDSIKARIRDGAATVDRAEVSPLFTAIADPEPTSVLHLRREQVQLGGQLEALARDVVRGWMLRGLDAEPPPSADQLESRLGDRGRKLREGIFAQVEAMALEGILSPDQARAWYEKSKTKPRPRPLTRTGVQAGDPPAPTETVETLSRYFRTVVGDLGDNGIMFRLTLAPPWLDKLHPDGYEALDPARRQELMKQPNSPQVILTGEQAGLLRRLDDSTREILSAYLTRGLDDQPLPSRDSLAKRRHDFPMVVDALRAHAEVIGFEAILTPGQVGRISAITWHLMGASALLDPNLSSLLKLSPTQRKQLRELIADRYHMVKDDNKEYLPLQLQPELRDLLQAMGTELLDRRNQADAMIWGVLTPSQMRVMTRLLTPASDKNSVTQPPNK